MAVVDQEFECGSLAIAEHKECAGKRVLLPLFPAERCQRVHSLTEIDRFDREQNPELRHQLQHQLRAQERTAECFDLGPLRSRQTEM